MHRVIAPPESDRADKEASRRIWLETAGLQLVLQRTPGRSRGRRPVRKAWVIIIDRPVGAEPDHNPQNIIIGHAAMKRIKRGRTVTVDAQARILGKTGLPHDRGNPGDHVIGGIGLKIDVAVIEAVLPLAENLAAPGAPTRHISQI